MTVSTPSATTPVPDGRISQIQTMWTVVREAHADEAETAAARGRLLERYGGAVERYVRAVLRDDAAAEEVMQEFALKLLRGDLRNADPGKGRFRSFVKTTAYRLVMDHHRGRQRTGREGTLEYDPQAPEPGDEAAFDRGWRDHLLSAAWSALEEDCVAHAVLRARVDRPDARSAELVDAIEVGCGKRLSPASVRVYVQRARGRFAAALLDAVTETLPDPTPEALEGELMDLGLLEYCRPALDGRRA